MITSLFYAYSTCTFLQRKCFFFVIFACNCPTGPHVAAATLYVVHLLVLICGEADKLLQVSVLVVAFFSLREKRRREIFLGELTIKTLMSRQKKRASTDDGAGKCE